MDNATVSYTDDQAGQTFGLTGVSIRTGAIVPGGAVPFAAKSNFVWKNGGIDSEVTLKGMIVTDEVTGSFSLKDAVGYASVGGSFLPKGEVPGEVTAHIDVNWDKSVVALEDVHARFLGLTAEGSLQSGDLSQGISGKGHLTISPFKPVDLIKRYFPKAPVGAVDGLRQAAYTSLFHFDEKGVFLDDMATALDDMTVRGSLSVQNYSRPVFSFDLHADMVDLDRYLPLFRTDTPFVWGDFHLDFFRSFRGGGRVRADGFKLLDTLLDSVRLNVKANGKSIRADADAMRGGQGPLGGKVEFLLGTDDTGKHPTFGMNARLSANSLKKGFELLNNDRMGVTGKGLLKLDVDVKPMVCQPEVRSIGILGHAAVKASLNLGAGEARFKDDSGSVRSEKYAKAALSFSATSRNSGKDGYGLDIDATLRCDKGANYDMFFLTANGPVTWSVDKGTFGSSGLATRVQLNAPLFRTVSDRISAAGNVRFDSEAKVADIMEVTGRVLETTIRGDSRIDASGESFKASGTLNFPGVNVHRIIYLLTRKRLRLKDTSALKSLVLSAGYTVSGKGFTLSDLKGNLDGMDFSGVIVGQGLTDPQMTVSLTAGKFDLDRYLPLSKELTLAELRAGKTRKKQPPVDLPLAFLRGLRVNGKASFEEFKLADIRTQSLTGLVRAEKGDIRITALEGDFYGGKLTGKWTGKVGLERLTTRLLLLADKIEAGALLLDLGDHEYLKGITDINVDLSAYGATDDDIVKSLDGACQINIGKGSFKFTGYGAPQTTERIESENLGQVGTRDRRQARTVFRRAEADFEVKKGVFTVQKFRVEAPPLLQSKGSGWFNLPDDTIKLSIRNDFVAVPSVTIDIVGKLSDPEVKVPKGKILNDTVRNILSLPEKSFKFLRDLFL